MKEHCYSAETEMGCGPTRLIGAEEVKMANSHCYFEKIDGKGV